MIVSTVVDRKEHPVGSPKIGLALGSGAARGWAHIGVIQSLREAGIEPDIVCGASIGSLVGGAYACGRLEEFEAWVRRLTWRDVIRYMDLQLRGGGFIEGERIIAFARRYMSDVEIESLEKPFAAVATELATGQEVWLREGSLLEGVRASCALPGLFAPVKREGTWLADGGLVNPVPISLCRAMGADVVIAVNLNGDIVGKHFRSQNPQPYPVVTAEEADDFLGRLSASISNGVRAKAEEMVSSLMGTNKAPGVFEVLSSALNIMQDRITRSRMAGDPPDILLAPHLAHLGLLEFHRAEVAIDAGAQAVKQVLPNILTTLGREPPGS